MPGKTIRYIGGHDAVDLEDGQTVARGRRVTVSSDLATRLLAQADNFTAPKRGPRKPKAQAPASAPDATPED